MARKKEPKGQPLVCCSLFLMCLLAGRTPPEHTRACREERARKERAQKEAHRDPR